MNDNGHPDHERLFVGALLSSPDLLGRALELVSPADLSGRECRAIYSAAIEADDADRSFDLAVLAGRLERRAGGAPWRSTLLSMMEDASAAHFETYARCVVEQGVVRRAGDLCASVAKDLGGATPGLGHTVQEVVERLQGEAMRLWPERAGRSEATIGEALQDYFDHLDDEEDQLWLGVSALDRVIGGLHRGRLYVIGARPGVGKTTLACDWALRVARKGRRVVIFSLEMTNVEIAERVISNLSGVRADRMRRGIDDRETVLIADALTELRRLPMHLHDRPAMTIPGIRTHVHKLTHRHGRVDLLVIDYLQLMSSVNARTFKRYEQITEISNGLKAAAKDLDVPVVLTCQLNRDAAGTRPQLHQMRESGAIEQDADVAVLLEDRLDAEGRKTGQIVAHIDKNRHGETGDALLQSEMHCYRIAGAVDSVVETIL